MTPMCIYVHVYTCLQTQYVNLSPPPPLYSKINPMPPPYSLPMTIYIKPFIICCSFNGLNVCVGSGGKFEELPYKST